MLQSDSPYVICEINTGHFGNMDFAKEAVRVAHQAGANAIKFQSFSAESLYASSYLNANPIVKRMLSKFSLDSEQLEEISNHCLTVGIDFGSTVYSTEEISALGKCTNLQFVKIASMDFMNKQLIESASTLGVPVVISTGMSTHDELELMSNWLRSVDADFIVLHCVSLYPTPDDKTNVGNIELLRELFTPFTIGFSDHSLSATSSVAAVAMGARVLEKHMALDKNRPGLDNSMAQSRHDFEKYVSTVHQIHKSVMQVERVLSQDEQKQSFQMRRSAFATQAMLRGTRISKTDFYFARPGDGIQIQESDHLVGSFLSENVEANQQLSWAIIHQMP